MRAVWMALPSPRPAPASNPVRWRGRCWGWRSRAARAVPAGARRTRLVAAGGGSRFRTGSGPGGAAGNCAIGGKPARARRCSSRLAEAALGRRAGGRHPGGPSPSGTAAASYFDQPQNVDILSGLPGSPTVARQVVAGSQPTLLVLSDDASTLLTVEQGGRDRRTRCRTRADRRLPSGLAPTSGMWSSIRQPGRAHGDAEAVGMVSMLLRRGHCGCARWVGGRDGSRRFRRRSRGLHRDAVRSGRWCATWVENVDFGFLFRQPTTLARLRGNAVFRLNEIGGAPLWLPDSDGQPADPVRGHSEQ